MGSTEMARSVLAALVEVGVGEVVLAPGSRNAPLAFAAADAAAAGLVRLHTRMDERSAAFLALGLTKSHSRAAVICTSGTAAANVHPAVLEAAHTGVRLVVVTADRPASMRGTSANQVTDQVGIYGRLIETVDLGDGTGDGTGDGAGGGAGEEAGDTVPATVVEEAWAARGPVHWNVAFAEPLTPAERWTPDPIEVREPPARVVPAVYESISTGPGTPRTVVVAGDDAGPDARRLAEAGGWPLLAEPSSGSRTGATALRTYRLLLETPLAGRIERVVVYGHPTLSRPVGALLARPDVAVIAAQTDGVWTRRPFPVERTILAGLHVHGEPEADATGSGWLARWHAADRSVARQVDQLLAVRRGEGALSGYDVAGAVAQALPPGGLLVVGPSNPIRDLDLMAWPFPVGSRRKVMANRGLAGIDGLVSTSIGAALARERLNPEHGGRSFALVGDVTFLHEAGGLFLGPEEPAAELTIVVVNDDGGSIFATLEQGAPEYADRFERLFGTPHGVSIAALCEASGTPHLRVTSRPELDQALASPAGGIEVIEVVVDRSERRELDEAIRRLAG
ncbi:MAG: 2-succinyl-5-enolpyruvyl-6-hydroxy-3-cyclohexene-1-carboxylic-acid synthase [Nocardioides sp.]|uniref:2-succinyl-5-enolpyruvyl-6-hydroxy-3- cyclohexene-1-carboxylic-acid synthase n=1 Tax=Nocardioides sp. TaxID=35761 RepID=UPI0039E54A9F